MFDFNRLRSLVKEKGTSISYISRVISVSNSYFTRAEQEQTNIPQQRIEQIAVILDTTVDYLTGQSDVAHPDMDLTEIVNSAKYRPEIRTLFSLTKDASKEDVETAIKIIKALKGD